MRISRDKFLKSAYLVRRAAKVREMADGAKYEGEGQKGRGYSGCGQEVKELKGPDTRPRVHRSPKLDRLLTVHR